MENIMQAGHLCRILFSFWQYVQPSVDADFKEFVDIVHAHLPEIKIVFISLSPTPSRWTQHEKEKILQYIGTDDLPPGSDGRTRPELFLAGQLHFNADGCKLLAERVRPFLPK